MQSWGSGYAKSGSRYRPQGRTTQQRGNAFFNKGTPDIGTVSFGSGTSHAREFLSASRGNSAVGFDDSPNWGGKNLGHGFQKQESRSNDMTLRQKRGFDDSNERFQSSEDNLSKGDFNFGNRFQNKMQGAKRGRGMKFDSYQTSSQSFGMAENRGSDRNRNFGRKAQNRSYDSLDSYRTTESREHKNWPDEEPYESLLNRTKIDIDSYRTTTGGGAGSFGSLGKTERYQTSNSQRSTNRPGVSQNMYNRSTDLSSDFNDQIRGSSNDYDKSSNRNYENPMDKYDQFQGNMGSSFNNRSTLGNTSTKMDRIDSYRTVNDFETNFERKDRHGGNNRSGGHSIGDDNKWRSDISSRLDYIIRKNVDQDFVEDEDMERGQNEMGSRNSNRDRDFVGREIGLNQNQNANAMRNRMNSSPDGFRQRVHTNSSRQGRQQEGMSTNNANKYGMQRESYFTQKPNKPSMFMQEDNRRQDMKSMVRENVMFKRQEARQQEREENKQLLYKKRQDMRAMGHQLQRGTEEISDQQHRGNQNMFDKQRPRNFGEMQTPRNRVMQRNNQRMMLEGEDEQERGHEEEASYKRIMEDRRKQEEMRRLGKLKIQQKNKELAQAAEYKQIMAKQARAMAFKNQMTIAKQKAQEKTIAMQSTLLKRQQQIAEVMRKRQIMSQNLRNRAETQQAMAKSRLHNSALAHAMSQRLKDRAKLLETQRRSLEIRSRLVRLRNVPQGDRERGRPRERRDPSVKVEGKRKTSAKSPQESSHCDVCNQDVTGPFKLHIQTSSHKSKLKEEESVHEMFVCDICSFKVRGPTEYHNALDQHKNREKAMKKGCELCSISSFSLGKDLDKHRTSLQHKKASRKQSETLESEQNSSKYCEICNIKISSMKTHQQLKIHKVRESALKNGCPLCKISSFSTGKEFDKHRASLQHAKASGKDPTVKHKKTTKTPQSSSKFCETCDVKFDSLTIHQQSKLHKVRERALKNGCPLCNISSFPDRKAIDKHRASFQHAKLTKEKRENITKKNISDHLMKFKTESDIPAFAPGKAIGLEFIIRSQGYACNFCQKDRKFYLSEHSAKVDHCKLKEHYDNWKKHEIKLIASEDEAKLTKTPTITSKESTNEKKDDKEPTEKVNGSSGDKVQLKVEVIRMETKMEVEQETTNTEPEKESVKHTSAEEQDLEIFKVIDSVQSEPEEKISESDGKDALEEVLKSEDTKLASEETTKTQVSPRGRGRGRVQKARRGRKANTP